MLTPAADSATAGTVAPHARIARIAQRAWLGHSGRCAGPAARACVPVAESHDTIDTVDTGAGIAKSPAYSALEPAAGVAGAGNAARTAFDHQPGFSHPQAGDARACETYGARQAVGICERFGAHSHTASEATGRARHYPIWPEFPSSPAVPFNP